MKRLSEPSTFKLPKLHGGQGLFPGITYSRDKNIQPDFRQFYERPWWKPNPYIPMDSVLVKRNFDLIDGAGFGSFVKRESGSTDTGIINNEKRNFDQIDGAGFGAFYRRWKTSIKRGSAD